MKNYMDTTFAATQSEMQESLDNLKTLESTLAGKKELQRNFLSYIGTKPVRDGLKAQKSEKARKAYQESHSSDFLIAEATVQYFKACKWKSNKLTIAKNTGYNDYREKHDRYRELQAIKANLEQMMNREQSQQKQQEQER